MEAVVTAGPVYSPPIGRRSLPQRHVRACPTKDGVEVLLDVVRLTFLDEQDRALVLGEVEDL